jgi:hypothetical protein
LSEEGGSVVAKPVSAWVFAVVRGSSVAGLCAGEGLGVHAEAAVVFVVDA